MLIHPPFLDFFHFLGAPSKRTGNEALEHEAGLGCVRRTHSSVGKDLSGGMGGHLAKEEAGGESPVGEHVPDDRVIAHRPGLHLLTPVE